MQKTKYTMCSSEEDFNIFFTRWGKKANNLKDIFRWYCSEFNLYPLTKSKFQNRLKMMICFVKTNSNLSEENFKDIIREYHSEGVTKFRQLDIRYGKGRGLEHSNKLKAKAVNKLTIGNIQYWLNKGLSLEEAYKQKRQFYTDLNKKGTAATIKLLSENPILKKERCKKSAKTKSARKNIQYWLDRGYTEEQAAKEIKKYNPPVHTVEEYINRHGEEVGRQKYIEKYEKQKNTKIKRYGTTVLNGYVSKASIKYFKPLYKALRKNGIAKTDILWGIGRRREFITFDKDTNRNYAFDFVIKSKKIIIEYNDPFWHARDKNEWKNPIIKYEESYERDSNKKRVASKLGFDIVYVWSDNLPDTNTLKELILK